jgi:hypothetical protein
MDRFDLEQNIMDCWHVVDDLKVLHERLESSSEDQVKNILSGMQHLYQMKFEKLFETYEDFAFPQPSDDLDLPVDNTDKTLQTR